MSSLKQSTRDEMSRILQELGDDGLLPRNSDESAKPTAFSVALELPPLFSKDEERLTYQIVMGLEELVKARIRHQKHFYRICTVLKELLQCSDLELAQRIGDATKTHLSYSRSWITKNLQAGRFLNDFPEFSDIHDVERLSILSRVPRDLLIKNLRADGSIGEVNIRRAPRTELKRALNSLREERGLTREERLRREFSELAVHMKRVEALLAHDERHAGIRELLSEFSKEILFGSQRTIFSIRISRTLLENITRGLDSGKPGQNDEAAKAS